MRKILVVFIVLIFFAPAVCWAENESTVGVINHVMATNIEYHQGQGYVIAGPTNIKFDNPAGVASAISKFATLDQLIFMSGTCKVDLSIIDDASGVTIATAKYDNVLIQNNNSIKSFVTNWSLAFKAGLYTYQLIVNDTVMASFKIVIESSYLNK